VINFKEIHNEVDQSFFFISRSELTEYGHGRKVFAIKFHPFDDNVFITGGWDKCIKVISSLLAIRFSLKYSHVLSDE
jgi:WD40 repeat protein